jgi:hypothetical protein
VTFKGTGISDLEKILATFPRNFTLNQVVSEFRWSKSRARQAIVNGQQTDVVRTLQDQRSEGGPEAVYENITWRKEWLMRAWHGTVVSREEAGR